MTNWTYFTKIFNTIGPTLGVQRWFDSAVVCITMLVSSSIIAQSPNSIQDHAWIMYFGNHRLGERWGLHTEYQLRRNDFLENWQQSLVRIAIDHYSKNGMQLTAGYAWVLSYPYGEQPISYSFTEHRIWQQLILNNKVGRFYFNHRYRLEQRFLQQKKLNSEADFVADGSLFKQRARYRLMISVALNHNEMVDKTLFLALYAEPFLQFGKHVGSNIMDQNRLYVALGYRFTKDVNVQLGYLNQFIPKADGIRAENNHTAQLGITYNLDFRKAENVKE